MFVLVACACACSDGSGPPLSVTGVTITRPLPGTSVSAGYFSMYNHGERAIVVTAIESPQFEIVEMHETVIENDVSHMRSIDNLKLNPGSGIHFEPGGKHVMLMRPIGPLEAVTLNFYGNDTLLMSVSTVPTDP